MLTGRRKHCRKRTVPVLKKPYRMLLVKPSVRKSRISIIHSFYLPGRKRYLWANCMYSMSQKANTFDLTCYLFCHCMTWWDENPSMDVNQNAWYDMIWYEPSPGKRGGGGWWNLPWVFLSWTSHRLENHVEIFHCLRVIFCATFGEKIWSGQVKSRSYDAIRGTTFDCPST